MYAVEVEAGRAPPLPDEIDTLILAEAFGTSPMELEEWPARWVEHYRLLRAARQAVESKGGGQTP